MPVGVVKKWHMEKGFGFISPDDGGEDVFCHVSGLLGGDGSVQEGDKVRFTVRYDDRKGKDRAADVELASGGGGGGGRGGGRGGRSRSPPPRGGGRDYDDRRGGGGRDRDYDDDRRGGRDDRRGGRDDRDRRY